MFVCLAERFFAHLLPTIFARIAFVSVIVYVMNLYYVHFLFQRTYAAHEFVYLHTGIAITTSCYFRCASHFFFTFSHLLASSFGPFPRSVLLVHMLLRQPINFKWKFFNLLAFAFSEETAEIGVRSF